MTKSAADRQRDRYWREKLGLSQFRINLCAEQLSRFLIDEGLCVRPRNGPFTIQEMQIAVESYLNLQMLKTSRREDKFLSALAACADLEANTENRDAESDR